MLAIARQAQLERELRARGSCRVAELAACLDVSEMTVRRDLGELARTGRVRKVHGGAVSVERPSSDEPSFVEKRQRNTDEKSRIAVTAAALVVPGTALGIGAGTTAAAFAASIASVPGITVVTNSLAVSEALHGSAAADQTVLLTGGLRTPSDALVGPVAQAALRGLYLDQVFLGTHGLDLGRGLTTPNLLEADTNRAFVAAARSLVVLADQSKWGAVGLAAFADLADVDVLVTEAIPEHLRSEVEQRVGTLVVAGS
jgi:DeoR/GlpR family transcriptional regulator of sugar metabolism